MSLEIKKHIVDILSGEVCRIIEVDQRSKQYTCRRVGKNSSYMDDDIKSIRFTRPFAFQVGDTIMVDRKSEVRIDTIKSISGGMVDCDDNASYTFEYLEKNFLNFIK